MSGAPHCAANSSAGRWPKNLFLRQLGLRLCYNDAVGWQVRLQDLCIERIDNLEMLGNLTHLYLHRNRARHPTPPSPTHRTATEPRIDLSTAEPSRNDVFWRG